MFIRRRVNKLYKELLSALHAFECGKSASIQSAIRLIDRLGALCEKHELLLPHTRLVEEWAPQLPTYTSKNLIGIVKKL